MYWTGAAALSLLVWIYLFCARGRFWRIETVPTGELPARLRVVAVVPARNEAAVIGQAVTSLLREDFPTPLHVVLVDDSSDDGTAAAARQAAQKIGCAENLTVLTGALLPPGWTGKLWAVSQGAQAAFELQPDYLLFTDADIRHHPRSVAELVAKAEAHQLDLASYMVRLCTGNFAEKPCFRHSFISSCSFTHRHGSPPLATRRPAQPVAASCSDLARWHASAAILQFAGRLSTIARWPAPSRLPAAKSGWVLRRKRTASALIAVSPKLAA
jgi:glycosyltransferase involved in cell wall biosynthesis